MAENTTETNTETVENTQSTESTEQTQPTNSEETKKEEKPEIKDEASATEYLKTKGFDYSKLQEEFNANGDITEATRKELNEAGIENAFIDDYIEGRKAANKEAQDQFINALAQDVGGKEELQKIYNWARNNLTEDEIKGIDSITGLEACKFVIKGLKSRMEEAEGVIPEQLNGSAGVTQANIFESKYQMMEAIKDPRYDKDPSYRERVGRKIKESKRLGYI